MLIFQSKVAFSDLNVQDLKSHLNVIDSTTDTLLESYLLAAVNYCEREMQMDITATTWKMIVDRFPFCWDGYFSYGAERDFRDYRDYRDYRNRGNKIVLPRGPLQSISSVQYYDNDNTLQTLESTSYRSVAPSYLLGYLEPVTFFPFANPLRTDAVQITFVTGFSPVPVTILHAIKLLVGLWWVQREALMYGPGTVSPQVSDVVCNLLGNYRAEAYA